MTIDPKTAMVLVIEWGLVAIVAAVFVGFCISFIREAITGKDEI